MMKRKKSIVLLCHCLLNCNSKIAGISDYEGAQKDILKYFIDKGYGIMQLPCPEITMYGVKRWGHVKEQFDTPYFRKHCKTIFLPILEQLKDYEKNGYKIKALIGVDGSPSCGINKTCSSALWGGEVGTEYKLDDKLKDLKMIDASGVFIEEILILLKENKINIKFIAVDENDINSSVPKMINALEGEEKNEKS